MNKLLEHCIKEIKYIHEEEVFTVSTNSNKSPTVTLNTFAISIASFKEGLYLPFSKWTIVSRLTPTNFASS